MADKNNFQPSAGQNPPAPKGDHLVDSALAELGRMRTDADEDFLSRVEAAIDAAEAKPQPLETDSVITPLHPRSRRKPRLHPAAYLGGIAACLAVGVCFYILSQKSDATSEEAHISLADLTDDSHIHVVDTLSSVDIAESELLDTNTDTLISTLSEAAETQTLVLADGQLNFNTASSGIVWDTAASLSNENMDMSRFSPAQTEWSAYPGHTEQQDFKFSTPEEYVGKMQELAGSADEIALLGSLLMAEGDVKGAIEQYRNAINHLPDAPITEARRKTYVKQYAQATTTLARQYADEGKYKESIKLIENVVRPTVDPGNEEARQLLAQMADPEHYSGALTPDHLEVLRNMQYAMRASQGFIDIGDLTQAEAEFYRTLNSDRYNLATNMGLAINERQKANYNDLGIDQTRASFLEQVAEGWELPLPESTENEQVANTDSRNLVTSYFIDTELPQITPQPGAKIRFGAGTSKFDNAEGFLDIKQTNFDLFNIGKINIAGNTHTKDHVIRRELALDRDEHTLPFPGYFNGRLTRSAIQYPPLIDNVFTSPLAEPLSTFSIDVDTASYTNIRRLINDKQPISPDAVRIEEMINYFSYDYPQPTGNDEHPFAFAIETGTCPWNGDHQLMRIGLQAQDIQRAQRPNTNLVFLIDVSGSMQSEDKLPLVKESLEILVEELSENDSIAIVVYAGSEGVALPATSGKDDRKILTALKQLEAGGSTNGGAGIDLAYKIAQENFIKDGVNRVILCTDGDFNVGTTDDKELVELVKTHAQDGTYLSALGYGTGNLNDAMLEAITNQGNGTYHYIDTIREGRKVLLQEFMSTIVTIAKDVKIQVEFNPQHVQHYRLIGYANRMLNPEDFQNDQIDAGEVGAGHSVTALYEIVPAGAPPIDRQEITTLKYQKPIATTPSAPKMELIDSDELCTVKLRYKKPNANTSIPMEQPVTYRDTDWQDTSADYQWASAVALWGMHLRQGDHYGKENIPLIESLANQGKSTDPHKRRSEMIDLISKWQEQK